MMEAKNKTNKVIWTGRIMSALAILPFLPSTYFKFSMSPQVLEGMTHSGFGQNTIFTIAILELTCIVLYVVPQTAILGAILTTGYLGGAICTHLRMGEPVMIPAILGVLIWGGIFLRDDRLQKLMPLRRK